MIQVEVAAPYAAWLDPEALRRAAEAVLAHEQVPRPWSLSIQVTDNETVHRLNRRFRGVDAPTDVLSFPDGSVDPESGAVYLGDIVIAYPYAAAQAERAGHAVADELTLLVVHGTLHLLGYDHAEPEEKARMWAVQQAVLERLGCPLSPP